MDQNNTSFTEAHYDRQIEKSDGTADWMCEACFQCVYKQNIQKIIDLEQKISLLTELKERLEEGKPMVDSKY